MPFDTTHSGQRNVRMSHDLAFRDQASDRSLIDKMLRAIYSDKSLFLDLRGIRFSCGVPDLIYWRPPFPLEITAIPRYLKRVGVSVWGQRTLDRHSHMVVIVCSEGD